MPPHSEAFVIFIHFAGSFIHASCTCGITESFVARLFVVPPHFFSFKTGLWTRPHYIMAQTLDYLPLFTWFASRTIGIHGIRKASDRLFSNRKLADFFKGLCGWHSQSQWFTFQHRGISSRWNLPRWKKTDVGFSLCGLSCRDLMQILIVCNIIDVCCPVFLGHHHNYTFWSDTALVLMQLDFFQTITAEEDTRFDVLPLSSSRASATFFIGSLHNWSDQEEGRDSRSGSSRVLAWYLVPKVRWQWQKTFSGIARIMTNK